VIVRGNWGRSYRVPSFNELYWPAGPFTAGNPDLEPEKGQGFDLGFVLNLERSGFWGFEVNHFNTNLDNLILWEPGDDWVWRPQNLQKADLKGFETRFTFQDTGGLLSVGAEYDYLDAVNESTDDTVRGKQLIYRPKHKASVDLQFHFDRLTTGGTYRFVGHRFTTADNSGSLDGYHTFDAGVTWMQPVSGSTLKIRTEVRNILDREIEVIDDYPTPGREIRTTVGFEF
jgi:outer membrane cobalamin receptor